MKRFEPRKRNWAKIERRRRKAYNSVQRSLVEANRRSDQYKAKVASERRFRKEEETPLEPEPEQIVQVTYAQTAGDSNSTCAWMEPQSITASTSVWRKW